LPFQKILKEYCSQQYSSKTSNYRAILKHCTAKSMVNLFLNNKLRKTIDLLFFQIGSIKCRLNEQNFQNCGKFYRGGIESGRAEQNVL